jgi:hypothetical protein
MVLPHKPTSQFPRSIRRRRTTAGRGVSMM